MPFLDPLSRLEDMRDDIARIEAITAGKAFEDYRADDLLRAAAERTLQRISDASRGVPDTLKAGHPDIPWGQLAELGDEIQHNYDTLDDRAMWAWATERLPPLKEAVEVMLREVEAERAAEGW